MVLEPFAVMAGDQDRDLSAQLWLLEGQKQPLINQLRALARRPNTRGKDRERQDIKRRLDRILDAEKLIVQQL